MGEVRVSRAAEADLADILIVSDERWGAAARRRYEVLLAAAIRKVADDPQGFTTRPRAELAEGLRSLHLRHARGRAADAKVRQPVHVIYYRVVAPNLIEIVRVLHERMEPSRYFSSNLRLE